MRMRACVDWYICMFELREVVHPDSHMRMHMIMCACVDGYMLSKPQVVLHLDSHAPAVGGVCTMDLSKGGSSDRLGLEGAERLLEWTPKLAFDYLADELDCH